MAIKEKCWKTEEGELYFDLTSHIWAFINGSRKIFITSWRATQKGPMTEVVLEDEYEDEEKQVIIEILEKKVNEELFLSEQANKAMKKVMELCKIISSIDTKNTDYHMISSLIQCVEKLTQLLSNEIKGIHTYYGNGLFFGMKKNIFGKIKKLDSIPRRCMEFPSSHLDSFLD